MSTPSQDIFTELRACGTLKSTFFESGFLEEVFRGIPTEPTTTINSEILDVWRAVAIVLHTKSVERLNMFCIPSELTEELQRSTEFNYSLLYNETLAFTEWMVKFHLFTYSKVVLSFPMETDLLELLDKTTRGLMEYIFINDPHAFTVFMQSFMKVINEILDFMALRENNDHGDEPMNIVEFSKYTKQAKEISPHVLLPKADVILNFTSTTEIEAVFVAICNILKKIKYIFLQCLDISDDKKFGSEFLETISKKAKKLENVKFKITCADLFFHFAEIEIFKYLYTHLFLTHLCSLTSAFLKNIEFEAHEHFECTLIRGWQLLAEKLSLVDDSLGDTSNTVVNVTSVILDNVCRMKIENSKNLLFQETIPEVIRCLIEYCTIQSPQSLDCSKDRTFVKLFDFFDRHCKFVDRFKSPWIALLKGVLIEQIESLKSCEVPSLDPTLTATTSSLTINDKSLEGNTDSDISMPDEESESESDVNDSNPQTIEETLFWKVLNSFLLNTSEKFQTSQMKDVHMFTLLCEVVVHLILKPDFSIITKDIDITKINEFGEYCCEATNQLQENQVTFAISIISNVAKIKAATISKGHPKFPIKESVISSALISPWSRVVQTQDVPTDCREAFDLSLEGLMYITEKTHPSERLQLFLLKCRFDENGLISPTELFPVLSLLTSDLADTVFTSLSHKLIPKLIGQCCCFSTDEIKKTTINVSKFSFTSLLVTCNCLISNQNTANITKVFEKIVVEKFVAILKDVANQSFILELLENSAIKFFNHVDSENLDTVVVKQLIGAFLTILSMNSKATQIIEKVLPTFIERFTTLPEHRDILLCCFKLRFGSENYSLSSMTMDEVSHLISFGSHVEGELLVEVVLYLVRRCFEISFVKGHIAKLARLKKISVFDLFVRCQPSLSLKIVDLLLRRNSDHNISNDCLRVYASSFAPKESIHKKAESCEIFIQVLSYVLPYLIVKTSREAHELLQLIMNSVMSASRKSVNLIDRYCNNIIKAMLVHLKSAEVENTLNYLEKLYGRSLKDLFTVNDVETFLFRNLRKYNECAMTLLTKVYYCKTGRTQFGKSEFNSFFLENMLPYINKLSNDLKKVNVTFEEKLEALYSLAIIMNSLESKQISGIDMNIKAFLSTTQQLIIPTLNSAETNEFTIAIIENWKVYIKKHPLLGPQLVEIGNYLLPLLSLDAERTSEIFHGIVVERENEFSPYISNLNFLPNIPELSQTNFKIKQVLNSLEVARFDLAKSIENIIDNLTCDNPEVKIRHLQILLELLRKDRNCLHELRLPRKDESSNFVVRKLIKVLMQSCGSHENLHLVIAECLGEIGAIDPGRLDVNFQESNRTTIAISYFEVATYRFPAKIISELCLILDDKCESQLHNCVYYAIQETLKAYHVKKNDAVWKELTEQQKIICSRLFTSEYNVQFDYFSFVKESPIYNANMDYKEWIFLWVVKLTSLVEDKLAKKVFTSCLATVKSSQNFARFLLPFTLLYALQEASEEDKCQWIIGEIQAIMNIFGKDIVGSSFPHPITSPMESMLCITTTQLVEVQHLCVQTVFSVFDLLEEWISSLKCDEKRIPHGEISPKNEKFMTAAASLMRELCASNLSAVAFSTQSYARAIRYLERYLRQNKSTVNDHWESLQKYYAALYDVDGVEGAITKMLNPPSLMNAILAHEVKGEFQEVQTCCEKGKKNEPFNIEYVKIHIRCLMNLDRPIVASDIAFSNISNNSNWKNDLLPYMIESAWKLSKWDHLDSLLKTEKTHNSDATINVGIGKLFHFALNKDEKAFKETLKHLREKEMNPIAAAAMESGAYIRAYSHLVRLHMITDVEYGLKHCFESNDQRDIISLLKDWRNRNSVVQSSLRFQEPMVNLQRIILSTDNDDKTRNVTECTKSWLLSAKIARKHCHFERAYNCLIEVENLVNNATPKIPASLVCNISQEKSKYYYAKGDKEFAIKYLSKELDSLQKADSKNQELELPDGKMALAKLKLLHATYADHTSKFQSSELIKLYKEVIQSHPKWEESHFSLAKYYDKILITMTKDEQKADAMSHVIKTFRNSLKFGAKHVYESVPRMLTVWFDLGSYCVQSTKDNPQRIQRRVNVAPYQKECDSFCKELVDSFGTDIPSYYFMTSFPQLLSRICHPYAKIRETLVTILSRLLVEFPKQSFWLMIGTCNNDNNKSRQNMCNQVFEEAIKSKKSLRNYFERAKTLSGFLIDLCNHGKNAKESKNKNEKRGPAEPDLSSVVRSIKELLKKETEFLLPFQRFMNVRLPPKLINQSKQHTPFPEHIYIKDIGEKVEIIYSLQRPKKITLIGSDGKKYLMMCKPDDDLRKDQRTMEFMNLVNFHLKKDPETRKRQLTIRTYTVVPLNSLCGLVEWVENLAAIRPIIAKYYLQRQVQLPPGNLKDSWNKLTGEARVAKFKQMMKNHYDPPVFSEFFIQNFSDPTAWYLARLAYVRSCAVMSIIGYIIGLGDRHLENILINVVTGQLVHVDFNVLFNKGETLQVPEIVPFRLTHNMVDAMGATGYEGSFRITCETTLRVMREKTDTFMSVLKPFVYDPLLESSDKTGQNTETKKGKKKSTESAPPFECEVISEHALQRVKDIEGRLNGFIKENNKPAGLPISVNGQVAYLIDEATNPQNLGKMYIGWAPFF